MSSRRTFKKFFFRHFLQKSVVVAVAKNIGNAKRNALHSKKMVLSLQMFIVVQTFTNICLTAAMRFISKNLEKYTLLFGGCRKIWFLNQTLKNFQKKSSSESFFRQRRFRRGVKKNNRNRRAKCNAIKHHVLCVEQKSRIYQTCHKRRDKK